MTVFSELEDLEGFPFRWRRNGKKDFPNLADVVAGFAFDDVARL